MRFWLKIPVLLALMGFMLYLPLHALAEDAKSKLEALEAAHKAGILTDEEYARKKAELASSEAAQEKLKALDAAHEAGILTDEEYARKKAELLGKSAADQAAPGVSAANMAQYSDPQGRFQFRYTPDWTTQALSDGKGGVALKRGQAALNVMPLPDGASAQQVLDSVAGQIGQQWQNYRELRRGQREVGGVVSPLVEFDGVNPQGMKAHGQITVLVSGITGYLFILIAPEDEPANNFTAVQPAWETLLKSFTLVGPRGKTCRHPAGFSFWYPDDWNVKEEEGNIQLFPPNPGSTGEASTELYFVTAESITGYGIERPDDPMVLEYLDMQIQSLSPALQRTGSGTPMNTRSGQGAFFDWGATGTGGEVRARVFAVIIKENLAMLTAMGLKELVESRDPQLRQIFDSFGTGEPQTPTTGSAIQGRASTGAAASAEIAADEVGDPNWGFKFRPPSGWKFQYGYKGAILGHDTIAGMILIMPHMETSFQAVQTEMQKGYTDEGVQLFPAGAIQPLGNNALAGEYTGISHGEQVKARGIGTFSPYGGGAYIIAITTPDKYVSELSSAADAIARSMQYFRVVVSDLMRHFAGRWASATTNTLTNITLGADGSYGDAYEANYYGDFRDDGGYKTGFWDATGTERSKGRWTVRGNKEQGVIVITLNDGTEQLLNYRVHVEKGQTYWNEYWFNGSHYSKLRE